MMRTLRVLEPTWAKTVSKKTVSCEKRRTASRSKKRVSGLQDTAAQSDPSTAASNAIFCIFAIRKLGVGQKLDSI
jgi:hypothetical protein